MGFARLFLLFLLCLAGCSDRDVSSARHPVHTEPGYYVADVCRGIEDLSSDDVLIFVNGDRITKGDYERMLAVSEKIFRAGNGLSPSNQSKSVENFLLRQKVGLLNKLMVGTLMKQKIKQLGITASETEVSNRVERFLGAIAKNGKTASCLEDVFDSENSAFICELLKGEVEEQLLRKATYTNRFEVTEADIDAEYESIRRFNERADQSNECQRVVFRQIFQDLTNGVDFVELGDKYSELNTSDVEEWETFTISQIPSGNFLKKWLPAAQEGDVAPQVVDWDDGQCVVKLLKIVPPKEDGGEKSYTLARITRYFYIHWEKYTRKETRKVLEDARMRHAQKYIGGLLYDQAVLEFPNGTNLFIQAFSNATESPTKEIEK